MDEIDIGTVEAAETTLAATKDAYHEARDPALAGAFDTAKRDLVAVRSAWRAQEAEAGRRTGQVGGDAVREA